MTRIIGGIAGSLKLEAPAKSTRPTADRIRESIFNRLESRDLLNGSSVLDLYAGTGALGLESMSRGAKHSVLVESNAKAVDVCKSNARLVQKALSNQTSMAQASSVSVVSKPVQSFLAQPSTLFDLVFIDPPYELSNDEVAQNLQDLAKHLLPHATVILERASRVEPPTIPSGLVQEDVKTYGDTAVYWITYSG